MDTTQYTLNNQLLTPDTLIPLSQSILGLNQQQSTDISSGYNTMNSELTKSQGNVVIDDTGNVFNINNVGVATRYPTSDIYADTSGQRGMAGTGNLNKDYSIMQHVPYVLNPNSSVGYDSTSKLYFNGNVKNKQSSGDEMKNVFAGIKTPIKFEYKGCAASPIIGDTENLINKDFTIIEATYGENCKQPKGNITERAKFFVRGGVTPLSISNPVSYFGDPAVGCYKNLSVTYECNGERKTQQGYYDASGVLSITCPPKSSISRCYSAAQNENADYFGLANVDKNTSLGTCYISNDTTFLNKKWTNPGKPIWSISVSSLSNSTQARNMSVYLGLNGNLFFGENTTYNETYSLYSFCKANKLPGCTPGGESVFVYDSTKYSCTSCILLANDGNLYIFRFCGAPNSVISIPPDLAQNPSNYLQFLIYSSKTSSLPLYRGWDDQEIASGVSNNIFYPKVEPILTYGQSIYSGDGRLRLTFVSDNTHNSLVLYTGDPSQVGCSKQLGGDNWDGVTGVAMNYIKKQSEDVDAALGKLAYVNRLGTLYEYTDEQLSGYSDKYTVNPGFTIKTIDSSSYAKKVNDGNIYDGGNSSIEKCQKNCSNSSSCSGAVIDNNSCYLIDNVDNNDIVYKAGNENSGITYAKYPNYGLYGYKAPGETSDGKVFDTAQKCLDHCNSTTGCTGVEYWVNKGGNCWTKSAEGTSNLSHIASSKNADVYINNTQPNYHPNLMLRIPTIKKEGKNSDTGVSYLISDDVNVITTDKYSNYNISSNPMTSEITDVSLMPDSITSNFKSSNQALEKVNNTIVGETQRIINESFTGRETIYTTKNKKIGRMDDKAKDYFNGKPIIFSELNTINKTMSNSSIQMSHLNVVYTCLFVIAGFLLIIAFSISL